LCSPRHNQKFDQKDMQITEPALIEDYIPNKPLFKS
jgi:hypothetical protein